MKRGHLFICLVLICAFLFSCDSKKEGVNYYFDPANGNDKNSGLEPAKAFKNLSVIRNLILKPGDSVLLKSGAVFTDHLYISCKGDSGKPIVLGKYGGDARPYIKGETKDTTRLQAVHVFNAEHFIIRDLEISNFSAMPIKEIQGLLVEVYNYGKAKDITIDNLYVHDIRAELTSEDDGGAGSGHAIAIRNYRDDKTDSISSHYDGLLVQNCLIRNSRFGGIGMWGNWERKRWDPSLNVVIRNNILDGISGHGIVPVACESPLVEYNIMKNSPQLPTDPEGVDGIWPWSCDNAVVQYNVVSDVKSQWDAYGFDADYNCTNSLFQYNLSFNNGGGFLLICNSGGWPKDWSIGNSGTVIRYNVSINDGLRNYIGHGTTKFFSPVIHVTGSTTNTLIEKNLIYVLKKPEPQIDKTIIHLDNWGKDNHPDSTFFRNNFIYAEETNLAANPENSTNHYFDNNLFAGELRIPTSGFIKYNGRFDKKMWYNANDSNWKKLINFLKDKSIPIKGKEVPVLSIIGY
jgi:hypothetical protein